MNPTFFAANRQQLCSQLRAGSLLAVTAFTGVQQTNDGSAPFMQEGNFWYLTGIDEPDWRLLIDVDGGKEWLVAPKRSFVLKMFDGDLTPLQASAISGVKNVVDAREGAALLKKLLAKKQRAYTLFPASLQTYGMAPNPALSKMKTALKAKEILDVRQVLAKMRAVKQPEEIEAIKKAVNVTVDGLEKTLPEIKNMQAEYEVDAALTYQFRKVGATHAFEPIIAAGKNACVLHHPLPKDPLVPNDWLLMDVGAKINRYSADITRTIPIGQPDARCVQVYEAALRIHDHVMQNIKAGVESKAWLLGSYKKVGEELKALGLIDAVKLDYTSVFKYMPHAISHGLGVDSHDPLGQPKELLENMVITVEAGIYIPEEGIGVRIEDDVLVTSDGAQNLSAHLPTSLEHIQKMLY